MANICSKLKSDKLFWITIIIFIFAFFIFRPYFMQERGLLYVGDDESYFAHATSLAFFQFPDYSKEYFTVGGQYPMHSIGPGIMAFPFGTREESDILKVMSSFQIKSEEFKSTASIYLFNPN